MYRRTALLVLCLVLLGMALSADDTSNNANFQATANVPTSQNAFQDLSLDTRIAILEDRLDHLEDDYNALSIVPSQLARIEEQIKQLASHQSDNTALTSKGALTIFGIIVGIGLRGLFPRKKDDN